MAEVRANGVWLSAVAHVSDVTWSSRWGEGASGCFEASWNMDLGPNGTPPFLRRGALVEIFSGGVRVWVGQLSEPDRGDGWELHAVGLSRLGNDFLASSSTPNAAVDAAITRGLPWKRTTSLSSTSSLAATRLGDHLTRWATSVTKRWGVFADGEVIARADPTVPTWALTPGVGIMGVADDQFVTSIEATYVSAVSGTPPQPSAYGFATVGADPVTIARFGVREERLDLTPLGLIDSSTATNIAKGRLALGGARMGWTNAITATRDDLSHIGGSPVDLAQMKAGDMLRIYGVLDAHGNLTVGASVDVVLGEVKYSDGESSIYLAPVGLVDRDFQSVLAAPSPPAEVFAG